MADSPNRTMSASDRVAAAVVSLRRSQGLTREDLAARLRLAGLPECSAPALSNIESRRRSKDGRSRRAVTVDELVAFADLFKVTVQDLLDGPRAFAAHQAARLRAEADRIEREAGLQ